MAEPAREPLAKTYDPQAAQARWLAAWEAAGVYHSEPDATKPPYTIVIPPPNVTGALHMGHALNNTLQDALIRYHRAKGYEALWMPGTDHAGIATQAVVERLIRQTEGKTRHDLGRDGLVQRIWDWKCKYEKRILGQLRELGSSCDWERTRFTLDETCARAVRETFFRMFRDGYVERGQRLVNWDASLQTSVADDETYTEDTPGGFWTFKYPVVGQPDTFIRFSTTRPETMLGDTAVCVHPSDERYKALIGGRVRVPLVDREIPIIADALLADPELGTGCVKVTPAHDPNDYACFTRHPAIGIINILNPDGTVNGNGGRFAGLERAKAREAVVAAMEELGLFQGREDRTIPLKYSDRSKTPIEPLLSDQWFVRMGDRDDGRPGLAQLAIDAVTGGKVKFFPERYANTYLQWLGEKRDWCVSRQLWWGHRIPIWYLKGDARAINAALDRREDVSCRYDETNDQWLACALHDLDPASFGPGVTCEQDPDVLDTWFSSALWPHSTLGWPEPTAELKYHYPTSALITSRDIITLWVARMVLTGLYNCDDVPFRHVYIHPKMLDGFGETMSKSKGNGIDPLDIVERYGADALRFQMVSIAGETQDSRLPVSNVCPHCDALVPVKPEHMSMRTKKVSCPACKQPFRPGGPWPSDDPDLPTAKQASERFEQGRNFATKLWNATRFALMNLEGYTPAGLDPAALPVEDRWILSRLATTAASIEASFAAYKFSEVAKALYEFSWTEFCDWYVEMSKGRLKDPATRPTAQRVLVGVLDALLRLVQPVMPFVAESLWDALGEVAPVRGIATPERSHALVVGAAWPTGLDDFRDPVVEAKVGRMQELVRAIREIRNRYQIDSRTELTVSVRCEPAVAEDFLALLPFVRQLAGVGSFAAGFTAPKPAQSTGSVLPEFAVHVSLAGLIDVAAERTRIDKQLAEKRKHLAGNDAKLANAGFVAKAPPEVIEQHKAQAAELRTQIATLEANAAELS